MTADRSERTWSGRDWLVAVTDADATIEQSGTTITVDGRDAGGLAVRRRWFRWKLYQRGAEMLRLPGITSAEAAALDRAIRRLALAHGLAAAVEWRNHVNALLAHHRSGQRWIPAEAVAPLLAARPDLRWRHAVEQAQITQELTADELDALRFVDVDLDALVAKANEEIAAAELAERKAFFDTVETTPLTDEQARAVVSYDNRVQVLAAAGSGKTSVMVARAAYAVSRGFAAADKILLLAFNRAAAAELQQRVEARFAAAGIDATGVRASTFHAFGLDVIGQATGEKPRLASWLEGGRDVDMVLEIVDDLRDRSQHFRYAWDLYRTLFANTPVDLAPKDPDGYDADTKESGFQTFKGDLVRSHSERLIANFLYLNGIDYEYERPYSVSIADATHSQYRPDFYYPDIDVWHEHWALDRNGNPPAEFHRYAEGMAWKRQVHASYGTRLVETTWAEVMFGDGLARLEAELTELGLAFDWNPDRPPQTRWAQPTKHEDLARLVRTFMAHVKSSGLGEDDLEQRLSGLGHLAGFRTRLFLSFYWPIHTEWQRRLAEDASIDFEDMLHQAAEHLHAGHTTPYELILVDELQDASRARARLLQGLLAQPGRYLLAVGDDWQAINRFAGADISVMTNFEEWFGPGPRLALTTTFRCTQTICDVSREFVSKNPNQFRKEMRAFQTDPGAPVVVRCADNPAAALADYLAELDADVARGDVPAGTDGTVSVDVLGRYRFERDVMPERTPPRLTVTFRTVHGAKGLEADYVVIPGMSTGTYGFPSTIADDPILDLAMPASEAFDHAEERRLLYVALTRARRQVVLIAPTGRISPFAVELMAHPGVRTVADDGSGVDLCPRCGKGTLVKRTGRYGPFLGCSAFPACRYTLSL